MLDPKLIRNSIDEVAKNLSKRGFKLDVIKINALETDRKRLQVQIQELQNERNVQSKAVGRAKAKGEKVEAQLIKLKELSDALKKLELQFDATQTELDEILAGVPNLLHQAVPIGKSEDDNPVVRKWREPTTFNFTPKDHVDLFADLNYMDFETAAKIAGTRFVVLRGPIARLQRALVQFMLDVHTKEYAYNEIYVPYIVTADAMYGTSQLPKFKEDLFAIAGESERYLISTSEIAVTNTVRESILDIKDLPLKYVCYSPCFRSEAGSYGKDMRGMLRQHQFEKVELVQIVHPEKSYAALEEMVGHAESILQRLEIPYQVVELCSAEVGFASAKTYDIEVWLPGQNRYREISSCSNTLNFQARRMKARFRDESGAIELVHTLNGSGLAVGRTLIALVENFQDELGRIHIPKALQPFMDGIEVID